MGRSWAFWGPPWADPGSLPWAPGPSLGVSWASLGLPMGLAWPLLGCPGRFLGLSWASSGGSGTALDSKRRLFMKPHKTIGFSWFCRFWGAPGSLLGAPGALLSAPGAVLASLGRLLGRPGWSWVALGCSWAGPSGPWVLLGRALALSQGGPGPSQSRTLRDPVCFFCRLEWTRAFNAREVSW